MAISSPGAGNPIFHTLSLKPLRLILATLGVLSGLGRAASQPNMLWITSEDHGPHLGAYGDPNASTPNVDALAAHGMLLEGRDLGRI